MAWRDESRRRERAQTGLNLRIVTENLENELYYRNWTQGVPEAHHVTAREQGEDT